MKYHTTKEGKKIKLTDLELSHLENILKWIERKAKEGLTVISGGSGSCAEDMWADVDTYFGKTAKGKLNYFAYKAELERRMAANKISSKPMLADSFLCALSTEKRCDKQCFTCSEDQKCDELHTKNLR